MTSLSLDEFNKAYNLNIAPKADVAVSAAPSKNKQNMLEDLASSAITGLSSVPIDLMQFYGDNLKYLNLGLVASDAVTGRNSTQEQSELISDSAKRARSDREAIYEESVKNHPITSRVGRYGSQAFQLPAFSRAATLPGMMAESGAVGAALGGLENPEGDSSRLENAAYGGIIGAAGAPVSRAALGAAKTIVNPSGALAEFGATRLGQKVLKVDPKKVAQFENVGIDPSLSEVSNSKIVRGVDNALAQYSLVGGKIRERGAALNQQAASKLDDVITYLNPDKLSKMQIGDKMMEQMRLFKEAGLKKESELHQAAETTIGPETPVALNNLRSYVSKESAPYETWPKAKSLVLGNQGFKAAEGLVSDTNILPGVNGTENEIRSLMAKGKYAEADALEARLKAAQDNGRPMPYKMAKESRTAAYNLSENYDLPSPDRAYAKRTYAALSNDMRGAAETQGKPALQSFDDANSYSREFRGDMKRVRSLSKTENPEMAYQKALSEAKLGDTKLKNIGKTVSGETMQNLGGGLLEDISTKNGQLDIQKFASVYRDRNKLSPEAKSYLFGASEDQLNKLDQFEADIAHRLERSSATPNEDVVKGAAIVGLLKSTGFTASVIGGARTIGRIISDPKVMSLMQKYADNPEDLVAAKALRNKLSVMAAQVGSKEERNNRTEATIHLGETPDPPGYKEWLATHSRPNPKVAQ